MYGSIKRSKHTALSSLRRMIGGVRAQPIRPLLLFADPLRSAGQSLRITTCMLPVRESGLHPLLIIGSKKLCDEGLTA
jgi:hypothetical protein